MKTETATATIVPPGFAWGWMALPVFAVAASTVVFIQFSSLVEVSHENGLLTLLLNTLIVTIVSVWGAALGFRAYVASGRSELLLAGSGLIAMGSSFFISSLIIEAAAGPNDAVTVHNLGVFCASIFHLVASLRTGLPKVQKPDPTAFKAASAYLGVLALTGLLWAAARYDWAPVFYIAGNGSTPVRQLVLTVSVALLSVAAAFLIRHSVRPGSRSLRYYGFGLGLIAMGLVDVSIAVPGSVLSWTGRMSQSIGHLYILAAFLVAIRSAAKKGLDVREAAADYYLESEDHYRTLVGALRSAVISIDSRQNVILCNPWTETILGYTYEEAAGRSLPELIAPDGESLEVFRNALKERSGRYMEMTLRRMDGREFPAEVLVFTAGGGWTKWTNLIIRDISNRKQAEERLRKENREVVLANRVLRVFAEEEGDDLFDKALQVVMEELESAYGVFGYIDEKGDLFCPSMSKLLEQCEVAGKCIHYPREKWKGLWSRALLEKRTIYTNEPPEVPPGHVPIRRNLAAPIIFHGNVIGLLNLAEKKTDYIEDDRVLIDGIAERMAPVLYAWLQKKLREDERAAAEDALQNKELRISQALMVSRSFAFEWNSVTDEVTRSVECGPLLGLNGDDAVRDSGANFFQRVHPDDRESFVALLQTLTPDSPSYHTKYRLVKPDGNVIRLAENGLGFFGPDQRLQRLTGISTDVTEQEKIQDEIRYLATFPRLNPNPIVEVDMDGHVRFCNPAAMRLFPDLRQRETDHPWLKDWSKVAEIRDGIHPTPSEREVEVGGRRYYQTLHFIPESRSFRIYGVDITGLKEAEEALRKAHERMAMILGSIDDGFFSLDREFRVTYVNERGANIIGQTRETMTGRSLWAIFPEAVGSDFECAYQTAMAQRVTAAAEAFYAPLNAWFEAYAYPSEGGISVFFRNISDRKRAEQALRESQADLSWAQAVGQIGSWRLNVQRNELFWSDENYRIFGVPKGTPLSYETFLSMVHPEDLEYVNRKWTAALHGEPYDIEHRIVVGDTVKWVRERAEPELDADGQFLGGFGITQDITSRKESEQRIENSLIRFELLAQTAEDLLHSREPQNIVDKLCTRVMELLDCQVFFNFLADESAGHLRLNAWGGIPVEEARRIERLDYGVAVCGCVARDASRIVAEHIPTTPDVRTELVKSYGIKAYACHPLIGMDGKVIGTLSFGTRNRETFSADDLTLMKAVTDLVAEAMVRMLNEHELRDSKEALRKINEELEEAVRLRTAELEDTVATLKNEIVARKKVQTQLHQLSRVFMDAADPIIIEDLSGTVVEMNREAELSYGYRREELVGRPITTLFIPERYDQAAKLRERCRAGEEIRHWEGVRKSKSGRIIPSLLTAFPLKDESGKIALVVTICKDLSIRKQMEEKLMQSQLRMKELSRKSLDALEADRQAVARELHDSIGGSLAAIKFGLEELAELSPRDTGGEVTSLETLISHLLDTIKETKRISASLRPLMLDDLGLLATIDWYTRQFRQRVGDIRFIRQIDVQEHEIPEEFKIVFYRVMQEAVNNAVKHGKADTITIRLKKDHSHFELEVKDNGCGFDSSEVFSRRERFSGFGLKSMQERAEICGGALDIRTQPRDGTCVRVTLPIGAALKGQFGSTFD